MLLSNQEFLKQLQDLFDARKSSGAVFLTEKRFTYRAPAEDTEMGEASGSGAAEEGEVGAAAGGTGREEDDREYPCLIRATDGKGKQTKVKISTLVQPADYESFSLAYGTLIKTSLSSLRKKRKTKRKAPTGAAAKELAAAKASGAAFAVRLTKVVGPRRGAGVEKRRKLQRRRAKELVKLAARRKREETR